MPLADSSRKQLHDIARRSIRYGITHGCPPSLDLTNAPAELLEQRATFVTLLLKGKLRGCIGMLEADRALAEDVNQNAFAAATRDTRFRPLASEEERDTEIHISMLHPSVPLPCENADELLSKLRPGVDGLILRDGSRRATFLPSVWKDLREPRDFLEQLFLKAGLSKHYWSKTLRFWTYEVEDV